MPPNVKVCLMGTEWANFKVLDLCPQLQILLSVLKFHDKIDVGLAYFVTLSVQHNFKYASEHIFFCGNNKKKLIVCKVIYSFNIDVCVHTTQHSSLEKYFKIKIKLF